MDVAITFRGKKEFESALKKLSKAGIRIAEVAVTRSAAYATQKTAKLLAKKVFTIRSTYMLNSIQVEKHRDSTEVGSLQEGFAVQESGGVIRGKKGLSVRIPTATGSREGLTAFPRTKLPKGRNRASNIDLATQATTVFTSGGLQGSRRRYKPAVNEKHKNWLKVRGAIASGRRYVYLDLPNGHDGIYRVDGGNKRTAFKAGGRRAKLRLIHDLSKKSYRLGRKPWLQLSVHQTMKKLPGFYKDAMEYQLRRLQ